MRPRVGPCHTARNQPLADRPSGDLLGDAVTAAGRRGVRVIARLDLSKVTAGVAAAHRDWLFVSATGKPQIYNALHSTCPSGEYYQQRAFEIFDEILAVASGKKSKSELLGYGDNEFVPWQIGATF